MGVDGGDGVDGAAGLLGIGIPNLMAIFSTSPPIWSTLRTRALIKSSIVLKLTICLPLRLIFFLGRPEIGMNFGLRRPVPPRGPSLILDGFFRHPPEEFLILDPSSKFTPFFQKSVFPFSFPLTRWPWLDSTAMRMQRT